MDGAGVSKLSGGVAGGLGPPTAWLTHRRSARQDYGERARVEMGLFRLGSGGARRRRSATTWPQTSFCSLMLACAAASLAIGTRKGEQDT